MSIDAFQLEKTNQLITEPCQEGKRATMILGVTPPEACPENKAEMSTSQELSLPTRCSLPLTWEPVHPLEAVSHQSRGLRDWLEATPQVFISSRSPGAGEAVAVPRAVF